MKVYYLYKKEGTKKIYYGLFFKMVEIADKIGISTRSVSCLVNDFYTIYQDTWEIKTTEI